MTEPTAQTRDTDTAARLTIREAVQTRLAARHKAERRFRMYGIMAVAFAATMLIILLVSIGWQAASAFQKHSISFSVSLDPALVVPEGANPDDRDLIAENVAGFYSLVRSNLIETFPQAAENTAERTQLGALVTRLAVLPAAQRFADKPELFGTTQTFKAVLNDDLDLYLKRRLVPEDHFRLGPLDVEPRGDLTHVAGDFAGVLDAVKDALAARAAEERRLLRDVELRLAAIGAQIDAAGDTAELAAARDAAAAEAVVLREQIADLDARIAAPQAAEKLDATLPSLLVQAGELYIKVETIAVDGVSGTVIVGTNTVRGTMRRGGNAWLISTPEAQRTVSDRQIAWTRSLLDQGRITNGLNFDLLTNADSTYPEIAGTLAAIVGSLFTMLIVALLALPIGVAAAIYLEEYAPKNWLTGIIEVNINNLAAVPSIVFGLLGAAVFLNFFDLPRSAPLVGGMVLALLTLPTVIIASRAALKAVPPSIRDAALGLGASRTQSVFHHVLPLAAPGMMTGAIIGLARALGETAPLLLIGMVAFVAEVPNGPSDEATALPVLIYKWSTGAERAWEPMTAAAIVVLLVFMILMNAVAVILRRRFERRW